MTEDRSERGPRLPRSMPSGLNHSVVTGTVIEDPRLGRSPNGESVILVRIEFPVVDPAHPQTLLAMASCEVEVSAALDGRHGIRSLECGSSILVAGQLSERWRMSGGKVHKQTAIVAAVAHPGGPPDGELLIPGDGQ